MYELAPSGATELAISHANDSREYLNDPQSIAVDSTGSVWVSNGLDYTVTQFIGAATAVVTPVAANLQSPSIAPRANLRPLRDSLHSIETLASMARDSFVGKDS